MDKKQQQFNPKTFNATNPPHVHHEGTLKRGFDSPSPSEDLVVEGLSWAPPPSVGWEASCPFGNTVMRAVRQALSDCFQF